MDTCPALRIAVTAAWTEAAQRLISWFILIYAEFKSCMKQRTGTSCGSFILHTSFSAEYQDRLGNSHSEYNLRVVLVDRCDLAPSLGKLRVRGSALPDNLEQR